MGDLGAIGFLYRQMDPARRVGTYISPLNIAIYTDQQLLDATGVGSISGVIQEGGTPVANAWVYLGYRGHQAGFGELPFYIIERKKSASDGTFSFTGLNTSLNCYTVFALDPEGGTQYNVLIEDRITPV